MWAHKFFRPALCTQHSLCNRFPGDTVSGQKLASMRLASYTCSSVFLRHCLFFVLPHMLLGCGDVGGFHLLLVLDLDKSPKLSTDKHVCKLLLLLFVGQLLHSWSCKDLGLVLHACCSCVEGRPGCRAFFYLHHTAACSFSLPCCLSVGPAAAFLCPFELD